MVTKYVERERVKRRYGNREGNIKGEDNKIEGGN
jgi:hypothetical protein